MDVLVVPGWTTAVVRILMAVWCGLCAPQLFAQSFNYAEALQKSLFFYEAQRSGDLPCELCYDSAVEGT